MLKKLYKKYMKSRFDQWRTTLAVKDVAGDHLERTVIIKMQRRLLKLAFAQFVEKSEEVRADHNGVKKGNDYNQILRYKAMKRMFNAMKTYIINFRRAKVNFRRVYRNSDYRAKKSYFYVWKIDYY